MGITPQPQQQPPTISNNSVNYQITTGTYQQQPPQSQTSLNNGGTGAASASAGVNIGTSQHPIVNIANLNVTSSNNNNSNNTNVVVNNQPPQQQQQQQQQNQTHQPSSVAPATTSTTTNNISSSHCCLIENNTKCMRNAGNASYSKRIEKQVTQRKLHLRVDPRSLHAYICEHHKQIIQSIRTSAKRKRKDDGGFLDDELSANDLNGINNDSSNETLPPPHTLSSHPSSTPNKFNNSTNINNSSNNNYESPIDFHSLQVNTLRKYRRFYHLPIKHAANKNHLADEVARHFRTINVVNEKDVINKFIFKIKNGNKSEYNSTNSNNSNNNGNSKID